MMAAMALLMGATMGYAQSGKEAKLQSFERLSRYLKLTDAQSGEVEEINAYLEQQLGQPLSAEVLSQSERPEQVRNALLCNLKLMKRALTKEQYQKYVTLINVTRANCAGVVMGPDLDAYLAEK